ncbi:hypothetical protein [Moorena sp. SIO3A5]|uniref:hypothetical protein n=1 Tax=Moorena sp. SIO3A5 TaxID=2607822 RepID=UPI00141C3179|nr:hypothetical protein [Moorena sp. SIO3A5]NEP69019.1 hypothetical protein [Moorena sp. SIO3A5]
MFTTKEQLANIKVSPSVRLWQVKDGQHQTLLMDKNLLFVEEKHGFDEDYFWQDVRQELKAATNSSDLIDGFLFCNFKANEYVYITGSEWCHRIQNHLLENGAITVETTPEPKTKVFDLTKVAAPPKAKKKPNGKPSRPNKRKAKRR